MSQASQLSPELARGVLQLARALLVAARSWTLYPPEHPTVGASVGRLADAIQQSAMGAIFSLGITPDTLMVEGTAADATQSGIAEAARLLHDADLLRVTFVGDVPTDALHTFLRVVTLDPKVRRAQGGPARIWQSLGHSTLVLEQIDYGKIMAREEGEVAEPARRDDLWRSIVMSIAGAQQAVFDERAQERLLAIAGSPLDIRDLAAAVMAARCTSDGSPMITSQAATVLAAFRHLMSIVGVMAPDRLPYVMGNLATAATQLDPHVVMQVLQSEDEPSGGIDVVRGVASAFDDAKVAQLLATSLALDGQASDRLATIFNTIVPDEDRKRRVLTLARSLLHETDFGKSGQFQVLWASMEELLISYNDKPFVSKAYRSSLDGAGARAERMATVDLPDELPEWMDSLGQENVRTLSVRMLIDLLTIEVDAARADDIAEDMEALAEDLLMAGAYSDTHAVTQALAERGASKAGIGRDACRKALDTLGESLAMVETGWLLGDVDDSGFEAIRAIVRFIGPPSIEALKPAVMVEHETPASRRAEDLILERGAAAVPRLGSLPGDSRWFVQATGARLLGRIGAPTAVPLLQPLLRQSDPRVIRATVTALGGIPDPSAARAIHTVLRAATGAARRAVIDALVADRDPRVVPMLVRILEESEPLGKDHEVVLETLAALGTVGSDEAVPALASAIRRRAFFRRRKLRAVKERGVSALASIGGPRAAATLDEARKTGDRMLKKIVAAKR
jgi:HEAT repeats